MGYMYKKETLDSSMKLFSWHYQDLLSGNCSAEFFYSLNQDKNQENSNNFELFGNLFHARIFFNYGVLRETAGCDSVIMQIMNFD